MATLPISSKRNPQLNLDFRKPVLFLTHILITITSLFFLLLLADQLFFNQSISIQSLPISQVISAAIIMLATFYTFALATGRAIQHKKKFLRESLFAFIVIFTLYLYGEHDRLLLDTNPHEDLVDFSFILFLVLIFWTLISILFSFFRQKLGHLHRSTFLLLRGAVLVVILVPLDIFFSYNFLRFMYDLPLYEDYWVFEIPLKTTIILLINFLDEIHLKKTDHTSDTSLQVTVKNGNQHRFVETSDISYIVVQNQISYLFNGKGQKFILDQPLSKIEKKLAYDDFFRANRQLLISRNAVEGFRTISGKKIELSLSNSNDLSNTYHISRLNAPNFRKWIKGTTQA